MRSKNLIKKANDILNKSHIFEKYDTATMFNTFYKLRKLATTAMRKEGSSIHDKLSVNLDPHMTCYGIAAALVNKKPFLVSRLGWFETYSIGYRDSHGEISEGLRNKMWNTPGIFPATGQEFEKFYLNYTRAMKSIDILALMECPYEKAVITKHAPDALLCKLRDLEPYYQPVPWSQYLEGLRVLVVHPFADSIEKQYATARAGLFVGKNILPEFHLSTLKPPQTLCGNTDGYRSWSDALDALLEKIAALTFDVAILGCGAYGLPAGASIRTLGKTCIHLGGATQALFGIRGGRWDSMGVFRLLMNDHWCRPSEEERPPNWETAEKGCYW